jgi:hypothetical protein
MAADRLGVTVRDSGHVIALDAAAMTAAHSGRPHRRKERIPPGPVAKAAAAQLLRLPAKSPASTETSTTSTDSTVIDLSAYERAAQQKGHQMTPANHTSNSTTPSERAESATSSASRYQQLRSIWLGSNRTPPPKHSPPSSTRPAPKGAP